MNPCARCHPEELLVAAAILAPDRSADIGTDEFTIPEMRRLWALIQRLRREGRPIDVHLLLRRVPVRPEVIAAALHEALPCNREEYVREIRQSKKKEAIIGLLSRALNYFKRPDSELDAGVTRLVEKLSELTSPDGRCK